MPVCLCVSGPRSVCRMLYVGRPIIVGLCVYFAVGPTHVCPSVSLFVHVSVTDIDSLALEYKFSSSFH